MAGDDLASLVETVGEGRTDHESSVTAHTRRPLLFFRVGGRWFAVPVEAVREVATQGAVTPVPGAPSHLLGVALVRGRLVPVVALEGLVGNVGAGEVAVTLRRLVIVASGPAELALVADETRGVEYETIVAEGPGRAEKPFITAEIEWRGTLAGLLDVTRLIGAAGGGHEGTAA